jgi:hypothetical protein
MKCEVRVVEKNPAEGGMKNAGAAIRQRQKMSPAQSARCAGSGPDWLTGPHPSRSKRDYGATLSTNR